MRKRPQDEELLTQAARKLGISRQSLQRLIRAGEVSVVKVGNMRIPFVPRTEIDRIVSGRPKAAAANENAADGSQVLQGGTVCTLCGQIGSGTRLGTRDRIAELTGALERV